MGVRWVAKTLNRPSAASRRGADGRCPEVLARRLSSTSTRRSIQGVSSPPFAFLPFITAGRTSHLFFALRCAFNPRKQAPLCFLVMSVHTERACSLPSDSSAGSQLEEHNTSETHKRRAISV